MDKEMKIADLEAVIEAILFTMGEAVELERIAAATEQDEDTCRHVIRNMMDRYAGDDRGIQIIELFVILDYHYSIKKHSISP